MSTKPPAEIIPSKTILLGYVGSIAHGTYIPKTDPNCIDDKDIMGICIAPKEAYFGLGSFEQKDIQQDEWDSVVYEIRKYFRLLLKQNPNVISLLWLQKQDYIYASPDGELIIKNRDLFISKQAYHSFIGYAHGQLYKMTHNAHEGYMGAKRKELVAKYGYDCKNAAHLIRLLRMGVEYLVEGQLHVFREDAPQLKEIKSGGWELERVKAEADRLFAIAMTAYTNSKLPDKPDFKGAEKLLIEIIERNI
jgi:predicted nucleotidyltransferase